MNLTGENEMRITANQLKRIIRETVQSMRPHGGRRLYENPSRYSDLGPGDLGMPPEDPGDTFAIEGLEQTVNVLHDVFDQPGYLNGHYSSLEEELIGSLEMAIDDYDLINQCMSSGHYDLVAATRRLKKFIDSQGKGGTNAVMDWMSVAEEALREERLKNEI